MNKKIVAIAMLVLIAAISMSACVAFNFGSSVNYDDAMKSLHDDLEASERSQPNWNNIWSTNPTDRELQEGIDFFDNEEKIIDDHMDDLKKLSGSESGDKKEYVDMCIEYLELEKKIDDYNVQRMNAYKDFNANKLSRTELNQKVNSILDEREPFLDDQESLGKDIDNFESRHSDVVSGSNYFVLV